MQLDLALTRDRRDDDTPMRAAMTLALLRIAQRQPAHEQPALMEIMRKDGWIAAPTGQDR